MKTYQWDKIQDDARALKEYFHGKCPYTDKHCDNFNCVGCSINEEERQWLESEVTE